MHAPTKVVPGRRKCLQAIFAHTCFSTMSDLKIKLHILYFVVTVGKSSFSM